MQKQLETIRSFRPRSALEDFLDRTVIHEEAGARMPAPLVHYALLGAGATAGIGVLGIAAVDGSSSGFAGIINVVSWLAIVFGGLLIVTAVGLSRARSPQSRTAMKYQLVAGALVPGTAVALVALYLAMAALVVWFMFAVLWAVIDP